jgi:hypothetical protein
MNRKEITPDFVYQTFKDLDIELQEDIELGSEEWMEIVSHLVSKDAYNDSTFTEEDNAYIMEFKDMLEYIGIMLY